MTYRPGHRAHRVLRALSASHARLGVAALMTAANVDPLSAKGRKFPRLLAAMTKDRLIASGFSNTAGMALYWITDAGGAALARLDLGEVWVSDAAAVATPSVRIFMDRRAA